MRLRFVGDFYLFIFFKFLLWPPKIFIVPTLKTKINYESFILNKIILFKYYFK